MQTSPLKANRATPAVILIAALVAATLLLGTTALADGQAPNPREYCENSDYNYFEIDANGDIEEYNTRYITGTDIPKYSDPPGKYVINLTGPGPVEDDEGNFSFVYNYESISTHWYIWRYVVKEGGEQGMIVNFDAGASQLGPDDLVVDGPPQNGRITVEDRNRQRQAPDFIVFCLVKAGSITIRKDASPRDPQDFSFSGTDPIGAFLLDDDSNNGALPNGRVFVVPVRTPAGDVVGPYIVTETPVAGWTLTDISCSGQLGDQALVDLSNNQVVIPLDFQEDIRCTFENSSGQAQVLGVRSSSDALAATGSSLALLQITGGGLAALALFFLRRLRKAS